VAAYEVLRGTNAVRNLSGRATPPAPQRHHDVAVGGHADARDAPVGPGDDGVIERDEAVHRSLYPKEIARTPAVSGPSEMSGRTNHNARSTSSGARSRTSPWPA